MSGSEIAAGLMVIGGILIPCAFILWKLWRL